jgi:hypothetical protein
MRMMSTIIILLLLGITACAAFPSPSPTPGATPRVIMTAWTAALYGKLVKADGCLQVINQLDQSSYTLVWPPDVSASITDDAVHVTFGLVTGNRREVVLHLGKMCRLAAERPRGWMNNSSNRCRRIAQGLIGW